MTSKSSASARDEAAYIARMCREMRDLASASRYGFLAYLLDMARIEAEMHAAGHGPGAQEGVSARAGAPQRRS